MVYRIRFRPGTFHEIVPILLSCLINHFPPHIITQKNLQCPNSFIKFANAFHSPRKSFPCLSTGNILQISLWISVLHIMPAISREHSRRLSLLQLIQPIIYALFQCVIHCYNYDWHICSTRSVVSKSCSEPDTLSVDLGI